jgi:hypothetical protein
MACKRCKLIRWGYLKSGTPRWRCKVCGKTRKRERKRLKYNLVRKYLIDGDTCSQLARDLNVHPDTVRRRISLVLDKTPPLTNILNIPNPCWLITDATHFKRWGCLFVTKATGVKFPIAVSFTPILIPWALAHGGRSPNEWKLGVKMGMWTQKYKHMLHMNWGIT